MATAARAAAALAVLFAPSASPCGYHADAAVAPTVAHAASLAVARAIGDEVDAGRLERTPEVAPAVAFERASSALRAFGGRLDPAAAGLPPVAVVLVEAHLWSRATSTPSGPRVVEHVAGPYVGDVVVVTGEPALRALQAGRLRWQAAVAAGLVHVDGPPGTSERLAALLASATP